MSIWWPNTIFNPTKLANPGLGLSQAGQEKNVDIFGDRSRLVPADNTSVGSEDQTSVVFAAKLPVVSAGKTSAVAQDIPILLPTRPRCGHLRKTIGMSWETTKSRLLTQMWCQMVPIWYQSRNHWYQFGIKSVPSSMNRNN